MDTAHVKESPSKEEVFARNIQKSQIKKVIPVEDWNDESFNDIREDFLNFMKDSKFNFTDQLSAWEMFVMYMEHPNEVDIEILSDWLDDIKQSLWKQANRIGNNQIDVDNLYYERIHSPA